MSGGHFDYANDSAATEIFGYDCCADYGMGDKNYLKSVKIARKKNPLGDETLSELAFDIFCLLHSYDWYICGDTGIEDYEADVRFFKEKWQKSCPHYHPNKHDRGDDSYCDAANCEVKAVQPVRRGRWELDVLDGTPGYRPVCIVCSECHRISYAGFPYCPNCGARMDGES